LLSYASQRLRKDLVDVTHDHRCFGSCYDCLRQYSNRFVHHQLDWRLGLDLLDLLSGSDISVAMSSPHWSHVLNDRMIQQFGAFGLKDLKPEKVGDFHIFKFTVRGCSYGLVPLHPLTNMEFYRIPQLREELTEEADAEVIFCCPYDLERQPLTQIQRIRESIERRSPVESQA
jgi:hypothetical protein